MNDASGMALWKIGSAGVIEALENVFAERGAPKHIRSDNGPEFVAKAVKEWLSKCGTEILFVEPGSLWEKPYNESFNIRLRDELLNRGLFNGLREARAIVEGHRRWYNEGRMHSSLGYIMPNDYAAKQKQALTLVCSPKSDPDFMRVHSGLLAERNCHEEAKTSNTGPNYQANA